MNLTEQYLTPEQIKYGFTIEKQADDLVILSLKDKKLIAFSLKTIKMGTIKNAVDTIWEAYSLGYKDALRIAQADKLFDEVAEDII